MEKKKVLVFSLAYFPNFVSGAEIAIKEITDRIDSSEIEFHVVTLLFDTNAPRRERIDNVEVHRVGFGSVYLSKILFVPLAALKARSLVGTLKIDAIWCMMTYMLFPLALTRMLGVRVPHMLTLQDGDPYEKVFQRWFILPFTPLLDWGFRSAKIIQAISVYLAEWPKKRGYEGEVIVVPNGASVTSAQEYPEEELEEVRKSLNLKEGEKVIVTVGRVTHQKAQDIVIRALPLLPDNIRYVMVGDDSQKEMYADLAKELGVEDRVTFTGKVDRTMTAKYRKISEAFVMPSRSEGQGISFLSTMIAGLPMVATQEGGIAEFLFDAKRNPDKPTTGWAVDVDSPEQIAEAVKDILAHPEKAKEVAANAKEMARKLYSWDSIAVQMKEKVFKPLFS